MTEALQVFEYEGARVRTVLIDGEAWLVAKDVCEVLGLTNPTMAVQELDSDERAKYYLGRSPINGGGGEVNVINEAGLYKLTFKSRKPAAKEFTRWVTHEVLPSIRKHGAYLTPAKMEELLSDPDLIIRLAQELKAERQRSEALEAQAASDRPKVIFAEAVDASQSSILIGNLAKVLAQNGVKIGQNRLFAWLRERHYLMSCRGERWNMPTQESLEQGLFEVKTRVINNPDGSTKITHTTKVTGKGQIYFVNLFMEKK